MIKKSKLNIKPKLKYLLILCFILIIAVPITIRAVVVTHEGAEFGWIRHTNLVTGNYNNLMTNYKHLSDGTPAYCLEPTKGSPSNLDCRRQGTMNNDMYRVVKNGYPNKKFTGNWKKDYYITQIAVWITNGNYKRNTLSDNGSGLMKYVDKLVDIGRHGDEYGGPTINFSTYDTSLKIWNDTRYYYTDWLKVQGNNIEGKCDLKMLDQPEGTQIINRDYDVVSSVKVGEKFAIRIPTSTLRKSGKFRLDVHGNLTVYDATRWDSPKGNIQDTVTYSPYKKNMTVKNYMYLHYAPETAKIAITKTDATGSKKLPEAKFAIIDSDGKTVQTITTNSDGIAVAKDLFLDTYKIKEIEAPKGYDISDKVEEVVAKKPTEYNVSFTDNVTHMQCILRKVDSETKKPLAGATFELAREGRVIGTFTSLNNGVVRLGDLSYGIYQVKEVSAPTGYIKSDKVYTITVDSNHNQFSLEAPNRIAKANVKLVKTDKENGAKLKDAKFDLFNSDGSKVGSYSTDNNGEINVPNLKYGSYYFVETQAPFGYIKDSTHKDFKVEVANDSKTITVNSVNTKVKTGVQLLKKDSKDGSKLQNARFDLYTKSGTKLGTYVTNKDGVIRVDNLTYGDYYFSEIEAPVGYNINHSHIPFTINESTNSKVLNVECNDDFIQGNVRLQKLDAETHAKLKGVSFDLYTSNNVRLGSYTTNGDGIIEVNNLRYGDYYFKETKGLDGYLLNDAKINFSIKEQSKTINLEFKNTKSKSGVQLVKTDSKTGKGLKGVTFDLLNASGNKIKSCTTDSNGIITVNNLEVGDYSFIETNTIAGYVINRTPIKFKVTLENNGKMLTLSAKNDRITGGAKLEKRSIDNKLLKGAEYNIYRKDNSLVGSYSLASGTVEVNGLEYGDYYAVETKSPIGYSKDETPVPFSIRNNGEKVNVVLKDKPIVPTVVLVKKDKQTGKLLANASFDLYKGFSKIGTYKTNNQGRIEVNLDNLPANYYFVETQAPEGYVIDNERTSFSVGELRENKTINLEVSNTLLRGGLNVYKEDSETHAKLGNAVFDLFKQDGTKIGTYTTQGDGHFTVGDLLKGSYYLQEVKAPEGYTVNTEKKSFTIDKPGKVVNITYADVKYTADIELLKTDLETKQPLLATFFELHKDDGSLINSYKTDSEGKIKVQNLKYGNYYFVESQPSKGYVKSNDKLSFKVDAKSHGTTIKLGAVNRKIKGSVTLIKSDAETGTNLKGAKFKLFNSSNQLVGEYTTNDSGQIEVNDLKFDSYKFVESEAPQGYNLNKTEYKFNIANDGERIKVDAKDSPIKGSVKLLKVDEENKEAIANVHFDLYKQDGTKIGYYSTDDNGILKVDNIRYGSYYFVETKEAKGYLPFKEHINFQIKDNSKTIELTQTNKPIKGKVKLVKTDNETKKPIKGAKFGLFNNGKKLGEYTTNDNGEILVNNLRFGDYSFKELQPAEGYLPTTDTFNFSIKQHDNTETVNVSNKIMKGKVKLVKTDSETKQPIKGTKFALFKEDGTKIGDYETSQDGTIFVDNLRYGKYYFKELKPSTGYLPNSNNDSFNIEKNGETVTVNVTNNIVKGNVKLLKVDEENKQSISGVKFDLFKSDGTKVGSYETNAKGLIEVNDLRYGDYYFVESKERVEYLPFKEHIKFSIAEQGKTIELTQTNKPIKGKVKLVKTDNETKELIKGARFGLYKQDGSKIGEYETDANGIINVDNLRYGNYYFKELKPSTGYLLNTNAINFKIEKHDATVNVSTTNQIIKGNVNLLKVDSETNEIIANTVFDLYNSNNVKMGSYTTDATGHLQVNNLRYGKYYFLESKASTGYLENKTKYDFDISENGKTIKLTAKNDIIKGNVKLVKTDNETNERLESTVFDLFKNNGTKIGTYTTNKEGIIEVDNLRYGDYFFKEVKPSEGYLPNNTIHKFSIREQGKTIELDVKNQVIKGNIKLVKLDKETKQTLYGAVFAIYQGDKKMAEQRTEDDGLIQFNNLRYGHYTVKELEPALGHINDVKPFDVFVCENGKTYSYDLTNRVIKGKIRIIKYDDFNYERVRGAKFHLYKTGDLEKPIADLETGHNGEIVTGDLNYGDYFIKEYDAPKQYYLNNTVFPVSIEKDGVTVDVHVVDMPVKFKLLINKVDKETAKALAGAQFQLLEDNRPISFKVNGETVDTFTSDENGSICLPEELKAGEYTLKEIKAPTGYLLAEPVTFTINRDTKFEEDKDNVQYYKVEVKDQIIKGSVEISKTDINNGKPLPNTTITIYAKDKTTKIFEGVTDDKGLLKFGPLNYGDYFYKESKAPEGYVIDETLHPFSIRENGKVVKCNMQDERIKGSIEITKSDINTGELLPNTAVRILAEDKTTVIYSGITNDKGIVKFGPLDYGKYYYQEYKAPEGYLIDETMHEFEIRENGEVVKAEMKDQIIKGGLEICKTDIVDGKVLPDTLFAIYDENGNIVKKGKTDENGIAKFDLVYGKYYYQELVAPEGYNIDHSKYPFEIKENGVIVKAKMSDTRIQSTLEITKVDAGDGKLLPNTLFEILDKDGKQILTGVTDKNGICKFTLDYGVYYYRELKAPEGYEIDGGKYKFEVKTNGEIIKAKMKDEKIKEAIISMPKTGDIVRSLPYVLGGIVAIIISVLTIVFVKKRS